MKSSIEELKKRGFASISDIEKLSKIPKENLYPLLNSKYATTRTSAAYNLSSTNDISVKELLKRLISEKCLYTKIAICETLKKGNINTAKKMIKYLGKIGKNHHRKLPDTVSKKKSYPLPRDIIARILSKMDSSVFPILIEELKCDDINKISEVLDAIGFMAFYNNRLATESNASFIINCLNKHRNSSLIMWKTVLCLSSFPTKESIKLLESFLGDESIIGSEAIRSLELAKRK